MKRISQKQRRRAALTRRKRDMRERIRKEKIRAKRLGQESEFAKRRQFARHNGIFFDSKMNREQIILPHTFSLHDNHEESVNILERIRYQTLQRNGPVMLHFSNVEKVDASAALALVAEIHRIRSLRNIQGVACTYPRSRHVYEQLKSMGFYRQLNIAERNDFLEEEVDITKPIFLPFITHNKVSAEMVDQFVSVIENALFSLNDIARQRLVGAIIEAMNNTLDHAHPIRVPNQTMFRRWWMSSWINLVDKEVTVLLFDQGVGIPRTLDPSAYERIRAALIGIVTLRSLTARPTDGEMILAATEFHRTGTGQSGRGKGFRNMKLFVDTCADGELRVLSNRGRYRYIPGTEGHADESCSIGGTVIEWRFRHEGKVEMEDD